MKICHHLFFRFWSKSVNLFSGNSFVSWRKRHSPGQAYQTLGTRGVPCVLWQTRRRWWPPVLLWDCQGGCCVILCYHGYQVLLSRGVGEEKGEGVTEGLTHATRFRFSLAVVSGDGRKWKHNSGNTDSVPGEGGMHSLIWSRRVCAGGYGVISALTISIMTSTPLTLLHCRL